MDVRHNRRNSLLAKYIHKQEKQEDATSPETAGTKKRMDVTRLKSFGQKPNLNVKV